MKNRTRTLFIPLGGSGFEVVQIIRKLQEEKHGNLKNNPIVSYLYIDTDKDYKSNNPEIIGSPFQENEKLHASVDSQQAKDMITNMQHYPSLENWFHPELERNTNAATKGAGQIRALGRLAFYCNYDLIKDKVVNAVRRTQGHEVLMQEKYDIQVTPNTIEIYVIGSLSGGTGSGMIINACYAIKNWLQGIANPIINLVIPMPSLFSDIDAKPRVNSNAFGGLMELSYYCDHRNKYKAEYSNGEKISSVDSPADFIYLVDTKNGVKDFTAKQTRQMIAENLHETIDSDMNAAKQTIRDNIKGAWASQDQGGRGYPKCFNSFGRSSIEIPIASIHNYFTAFLAQKLISYWLNLDLKLHPQMRRLVEKEIFEPIRLTIPALNADIAMAEEVPYNQVIANFVNQIRQEILNDNLLECTQQGMGGMISAEKGAILQFTPYFQDKVNTYLNEHFAELSTDERDHGDYFKKMYDNRNNLTRQLKQVLIQEVYHMVENRTCGSVFTDAFFAEADKILSDYKNKFRQQRDAFSKRETQSEDNYQDCLHQINEFKDKWGMTKQADMEGYCEQALVNLQTMLQAKVGRKARTLNLQVIEALEIELKNIEARFNSWVSLLKQKEKRFSSLAMQHLNQADAVSEDGIKLFEREEIKQLWNKFISSFAHPNNTSKSDYEVGLEKLCQIISPIVLQKVSPLWKEDRQPQEIMSLLDFTEIAIAQQKKVDEIIEQESKIKVQDGNNSIKSELCAADRVIKVLQNNQGEIKEKCRNHRDLSLPFINLSSSVLARQDVNFTPLKFSILGIEGGSQTTVPSAHSLVELLEEFYSKDAIKSIETEENYKIVFHQEIGGFSLRCIENLSLLKKDYLKWKANTIKQKQKKLRGENSEPPIPVHICKEPPFWDIFPENPNNFRLLILAKALQVLLKKYHKVAQENVIYYSRPNDLGNDNIILGSTWEEALQFLEIEDFEQDREEIEHQVQRMLENSQSMVQKERLFEQLTNYLQQRVKELESQRGEESPEYLRERKIILDVIKEYNLKIDSASDILEVSLNEPEMKTLPPASVSTPDETETNQADMIDKLKELEQLIKSGLVNEEEAKIIKNRILNF